MEETYEGLFEFEDTQKGKYLIFSLSSEEYGIEIKYVTEIIGMQAITQVPDIPGYIKGIINLRGKIIPVMDVRLRFNKEPRDYDCRTCIIVIEIKNISIGLAIDRVVEVLDIADKDISDPPSIGNASSNRYIKGIGKVGDSVKLLIDCGKLINYGQVEENDVLNIV
ncbi:MAG: chemotaxis protein CheW [Bacillota bacterium]|nr:chemotaxis protein CheW [Bacillota bacterium]